MDLLMRSPQIFYLRLNTVKSKKTVIKNPNINSFPNKFDQLKDVVTQNSLFFL